MDEFNEFGIRGFNTRTEDLYRMRTHTWMVEGPDGTNMAKCVDCDLVVEADFFIMANIPDCPGPGYQLIDRAKPYPMIYYTPKHRKEEFKDSKLGIPPILSWDEKHEDTHIVIPGRDPFHPNDSSVVPPISGFEHNEKMPKPEVLRDFEGEGTESWELGD